MSFYGYRSSEMFREIAKWADERATVTLAICDKSFNYVILWLQIYRDA